VTPNEPDRPRSLCGHPVALGRLVIRAMTAPPPEDRTSERLAESETPQKMGGTMRPKERRETGEGDLFRSRLDQIIDAPAIPSAALDDRDHCLFNVIDTSVTSVP
jgi:hypothetical protein